MVHSKEQKDSLRKTGGPFIQVHLQCILIKGRGYGVCLKAGDPLKKVPT